MKCARFWCRGSAPDLPVETLPLPQLIEVVEGSDFDAEGLRLRLSAEAPGAVFDDHTRWREPWLRRRSGCVSWGFCRSC